MSVWDQLQQLQEHERFLEEHCEHGVPRDGGHPCPECVINSSPEDRDEYEREYNEYLKERMNGTVRAD